jgi:hypothetical protein
MDPLAPLSRSEPCWCGSALKYKRCHGDHRPASQPGAPVPQDREGSRYLSPRVAIADGAIRLDEDGVPLTLPVDQPTSKPVEYTNWDEQLISVAAEAESAMKPADLGMLRGEVLHRLAGLPMNDADPSDDVKRGVFYLAAESVRTVAALAQQVPKPTVLMNEELDPAAFLGRTLLLADHVVLPDRVFDTLLRRGSNEALRKAAAGQLTHGELIKAGIVVPVARGVSMAAKGSAAVELTNRDLMNSTLVSWMRDQLILEGPTAREALFVRAMDDWSTHASKFWLYGHLDRDSVNAEDGTFQTRLLQPYDPTFDYRPWIKQVTDSAVGYYVQRTNERVVAADVYASEYVAASMFEARLLSRRGAIDAMSPAQAAMWAGIPQLPALTAPDLVKVLQNEAAVHDLRRQVRASLVTARTPGDKVDSLTSLSHDLEAASHRLERAAGSDRAWQGAAPTGLGTASLAIGAFAGGLPAVAAGVVGLLAGVAPYLAARVNSRRDAAYLFVTARRRQR